MHTKHRVLAGLRLHDKKLTEDQVIALMIEEIGAQPPRVIQAIIAGLQALPEQTTTAPAARAA